MRIFVTGASGFIGRHLIPLLDQHQLLLMGRQDKCFSAPHISYVRGDLADAATWVKVVEDFAPEACIHLAWLDLPDYSLLKNLENFNLSVRLFEFLRRQECKKIFVAGTCWEYGALEGQLKENAVPQTMNLFASFKTALREVGENLAREAGIHFIWGRIFFVYGAGQRTTSLIPSCYRALKEGHPPQIDNIHALRDFIHVSDVVAAIRALIETSGVLGVFNIGSGIPSKVGDVCRLVAQSLGREGILSEGSLAKERGFWADVSKLKERTNWKPEISLSQGVEATVRHLLEEDNGYS